MPNIEVYSDGSGTTKFNTGGWGYVLLLEGQKKEEGSGQVPASTNNDMELEASIQGLIAANRIIIESSFNIKDCVVTLVSDSQIILGWAGETLDFKQLDKLPKYDMLILLMRSLGAKTRWVRGHSGNEFNERCDKLANKARLEGIPNVPNS